MTGNITKKRCRQHVANYCLGVRPPLDLLIANVTKVAPFFGYVCKMEVFAERDYYLLCCIL
jgi:hypothetical protein